MSTACGEGCSREVDFPVPILTIPRAVRLVATARLRDPVLLGLVPRSMLDDLAEIEGATSARLHEQRVAAETYPSNRPHASFVNAAFTYFRPREMNRFNGPDRGAWYAALTVETSLAEVSYHIGRELDRVGDYHATVDYAEVWASFAGAFVDLREQQPRPTCLDPDPASGYPAGNALAAEARAAGHNGIIYPSVRHIGGTCLVALWPHAVQSVAQGAIWRTAWAGDVVPRVEALSAMTPGADVQPDRVSC
jgi:RES domain-containing protein